jgi:chromosome segregation ATPase
VQYLAEVRKTQAMLGGGKVEIRLLARNTSENNWQAVGNEEVLQIQDTNQAKDLKDGQMVLAEINLNKQVQGIQDAAKRIVLTLQTFTRAQEKFKQSEEDIEQWKQSLNYQSQELHRREMELEQREQELEQVDARKQEVDALQDELRRDREEFEQWRQQFEVAQSNFEAQAASLNQDQASALRDIAQRIALSFGSPDSLQNQVRSALDTLYSRQESLTQFWQGLESQRAELGHLEGELSRFNHDLSSRRQQWQQIQGDLIDAQGELKAQTEIAQVREEHADTMRLKVESQRELLQQANQIIQNCGGTVSVLSPEEVKELEAMSLEQLTEAVESWQKELEKTSNFVGQQEDELASLEGEIADLQGRIDRSNDFASIELEGEKESLEEQYKFLEETLAGQRRTMQERQAVLDQQKSILEKRQSADAPENPAQGFLPLVTQIEAYKQQYEQELDRLESQLAAAKDIFHQQENLVGRLKAEHQQNYQEIQTLEVQLQEKVRAFGELIGKVSLQEDILRPVQDIVDTLRANLEAATSQQGSNQSVQEQQQLVEALQNTINSLIPA